MSIEIKKENVQFHHFAKKIKIKNHSLDEQLGFQSQLILMPRTILYIITALADFGVLYLKPIIASGTLSGHNRFSIRLFCRRELID